MSKGRWVKEQVQRKYHEKVRLDPAFEPTLIRMGQDHYVAVKTDTHCRATCYTDPTPERGARMFNLEIEVRMGATDVEVV